MTTKAKLSIIALFSCCAMIGMGFANWTISQGASGLSAEVSGTVTAESVLSCSEPKISALHYSSLGFTDGEEGATPQLTTQFTVGYTIAPDGYGGTAALAVTMGYSAEVKDENNLFKHASLNGDVLSASVTVGEDPMPEAQTSFSGNTHITTATVVFSGVASPQTVIVTYRLNFGSLEDYTTYFYNAFSANSGLQFTFNAQLSGGVA